MNRLWINIYEEVQFSGGTQRTFECFLNELDRFRIPYGLCFFSRKNGLFVDASTTHNNLFGSVSPSKRNAGSKYFEYIRRFLPHLPGTKTRSLPAAVFEPGDVILNIIGLWSHSHDIYQKIKVIKSHLKMNYVCIAYDVTLSALPHLTWTSEFADRSPPEIVTTDLFLAISKSTRSDLVRLLEKTNLPIPPIEIIRLGDRAATGGETTLRAPKLVPKSFILFVSTVEPRKNHILLYQAWQQWLLESATTVPFLVFAGAKGWHTDNFLRELTLNPMTAGKIIHVVPNEGELEWLYQNCLFTIYPSLYEGWGLPVAESLARGKYCLTTPVASIPEVGGDLVGYFSPFDPIECLSMVKRLWNDEKYLEALEARIRREYREHTWTDCIRQIFGHLERHFSWRANFRGDSQWRVEHTRSNWQKNSVGHR